ncbi:molybdopterin-guanine dinucleotide biosynthesis protein MobB, partial [Aeromonas caviae]
HEPRQAPPPLRLCARLLAALPPSAEQGVVPGLLSQDEAGTLLVRPVDGGHDSANCRIERAPGSLALPPGERVMVRLPTGAPV